MPKQKSASKIQLPTEKKVEIRPLTK